MLLVTTHDTLVIHMPIINSHFTLHLVFIMLHFVSLHCIIVSSLLHAHCIKKVLFFFKKTNFMLSGITLPFVFLLQKSRSWIIALSEEKGKVYRCPCMTLLVCTGHHIAYLPYHGSLTGCKDLN